MILTFVKYFGAYTPGDSAGFDEIEAQRMLRLGVARADGCDQPPAEASQAPAAPSAESEDQTQEKPRRGRPAKQ